MFKYKCYIENPSKYVIEALESMGYTNYDSERDDYTMVVVNREQNGTYELLGECSWIDSDLILCKNTFEFLAIAGINDSTQAYQYYVSETGRFYMNCGESLTHRDLENFINLELDLTNNPLKWRKATVQEIINLYKNKKGL